MSGRKYSRVELANNVREALGCRIAAEQVYARGRALLVALQEVAQTTQALRPIAATAEDALHAIGQQLDELKGNLTEATLMNRNLPQVRAMSERIQDLSRQVEAIARQCRSGSHAAAMRTDLVALLQEMRQNHAELEPWLHNSYDAYTEETHAMIAQIDQQLLSRGTVDDLDTAVSEQIANFATMREQAVERRLQDAQRKYVAEALKKVCSDMGFSSRNLPQGSPLEDLIIEVETYAYGLIQFRLMLDGTIRSLSEMIADSCGTNFARIEAGLRTLNVISEFRFEGNQNPVRLQKGERSLSNSEPTSVLRKETS